MTRCLLPCFLVTCFVWASGICADAFKNDHAKSPHAEYVLATRAAVASLKSNIENFRLSLIYHGVDAGKGRSLHLSVAALPDVSSATDLVVRIDRDQAASLIGQLATAGILYRGTINREKLRAHPNEPYYELWIAADEKDQYFDDFPLKGASRRWPGTTGPTLIQQIDSLRAVLTGDAGKAMDTLRETLETPR